MQPVFPELWGLRDVCSRWGGQAEMRNKASCLRDSNLKSQVSPRLHPIIFLVTAKRAAFPESGKEGGEHKRCSLQTLEQGSSRNNAVTALFWHKCRILMFLPSTEGLSDAQAHAGGTLDLTYTAKGSPLPLLCSLLVQSSPGKAVISQNSFHGRTQMRGVTPFASLLFL